MKFLSWNCRGVGNDDFRLSCKEVLRVNKPDVICFLETKTTVNLKSLAFMRNFGIQVIFFLMFYHLIINIFIAHLCRELMAFITFAYVQPHDPLRVRFWRDLSLLSDTILGPWVVMGDMNDFVYSSEAFPASSRSRNRNRKFLENLERCNIMSMDALGCPYTWVCFRGGRVVLRERLDRAMANFYFYSEFPEAKLINLTRAHSDHHPIMLITEDPPVLQPHPPSRHFFPAWLERVVIKIPSFTMLRLPCVVQGMWSLL